MTQTMKAAVVTEFGKPLAIREVNRPKTRSGRVLVEMRASGVCHTDLHAAHGDWPVKPEPPFIPGHEGVGVVAEVGEGVRGIREGDRVGVPWLHSACGHCRHCVGGWETLCGEQENTGYSVNGGFAEYVDADPAYLGHLPDKLGFVPAAPILCAGVTVYKGLKETEVKPGETVAIVGVGGLGHLAVQYAKAMGMDVVAVDISEDKLRLARECGANTTINAIEVDPGTELQKGGGVEGVLVTAVSTSSFAQGVEMLARGGTMALVGLPPGGFELPIFDVVLSRKTIRGSIVGTRNDLREALEFAGDGAVTVHQTTERLEAINDIFDRMERGRIDGRVVLDFE
ncbi:alcohol dehydrogenase AdhP [Parvularcula sp. ZS-1/3]|uniref:alcohol dehydrogenase n=1 Tax=Parvularcula mediterranea TaxID=2732508 RepID=A0A7Y3RNV7_9PROT|nr:alcohol dehydrogenase AdhP [Parvularcula mediterranea]NNU17564.1 alcohol dehydrogenase AdhP [Parvularcula mediterranea]